MSDDNERSAVDAALDACGKAAGMLAVGAIDAAQRVLMAAADALKPTLTAHAMRQAERRVKEREGRQAAERQHDRERTRRLRAKGAVECVDLWANGGRVRAGHLRAQLAAFRFDTDATAAHIAGELSGRLFRHREAAYDTRQWRRIGNRQVPVGGASYDRRRRVR